MDNVENTHANPYSETCSYTSKKDLLKSQKDYPPFGEFFNENIPVGEIYRTSGTTGEPLLLTFSAKDVDLITEIGSECFSYSGMGSIGNKEIVINCLNLSMWAGGVLDSKSMQKTGVKVINFGTGNTSELIKLIIKLNSEHKVSLHCTPSYLPIIKKRLEKEFSLDPRELNIWKFYLGAEGGLQNEKFRNSLMKEWGTEVYNSNYGMSEVCSIMASADSENVLRFSPKFLDNYECSLLTASGDSISFDEVSSNDEGELVVTSLKKESQPVCNYRTNENIKIKSVSGREIFFEIVGRKDDMIVYKGINFFPEQLRTIILENSEFTGNYKIEARRKGGLIQSLNLICEINSNVDSADIELKEKLQALIRNRITITIDINFAYVLPLTGNKSKLLHFIED